MAGNKQRLITLDPTSGPLDRKDPRALPKRPETLNGAVIGLVANGLGSTKVFMDALYEELARSDEVIGAVKVLKGSVAIPPYKEDWQRITSEATVAITGFGG